MREYVGLIMLAITLPFVLAGSYLSMKTYRNELVKWPASGSSVRQDYDHFRERFDSNDMVLIAWPGSDLADQRVVNVQAALENKERQPFFSQVWSGRSVYDDLRNEIGLSHKTSLKRLRGSLIAKDDEQTFIVATLSAYGIRHRARAFEFLNDVLVGNAVDMEQVRLAGPANDLYQIDYEGFWSPLRAVPFIGILAFVLTWVFVKQFKLAFFISVMSIYTGQLALAIVYVSGTHLNALVWTMPTLVLLLTTSAALHFLGYYRDAIARGSMESAYRRSRDLACRPILYCAITTAAGLFSLTFSDTLPVRQFGLFGGVAVLASCAIVLSCLPVWLKRYPWLPKLAGENDLLTTFFDWLANTTRLRRRPIIIVTAILLPAMAAAIPAMKTSVNIENFFPANSRVVRDSEWFESNVSPLSSIELLLTFENASADNDVSRMKFLQFLDREFRANENITGLISPATYAPRWPKKSRGARNVVDRQLNRSKVNKIKSELVESGLVSVNQDDKSETWRMSLRIADARHVDFNLLTDEFKRTTSEIFERTRDTKFIDESLELTSTGHSIIFDFVEKQFLRDLIVTYGTAFAFISVLILFVLRNVAGVAIASLPNVFPAVVVLGGISMAGIDLDVASLMTASIALGIAVDDTLHFVLWWRKEVRQGMDQQEAIVHAMQHCGLAMIQTTVVCGVSVALYAFCGFLPTVRFGILLSAMLFAALIGDLVLLPAILSTRLGRHIAGTASSESNLKYASLSEFTPMESTTSGAVELG